MRKLLCGVAGCLFLLSASGEWVNGMSRQLDEVERRARAAEGDRPGQPPGYCRRCWRPIRS
ncbi:hypothetical protein HF324_20185 [Chitinophaga oryzae]|uniref:YtxH domain-containing protein n=1 Tax=Chitinophaga oryzae TaxID=2725414 RepID=A0ABX6LIZ6_9BACT|nr:hypothetical protein [Chitinophaga oryzae]QJB40051.1 hypothetical protein HF324_20185 [Chitinophaga oryzae]